MKTLIAMLAFTVPVQANGIDLMPHYETPRVVEKVSHVQPKRAHKAKAKQRKGHSFRPAPATAPPKIVTDAVTRCLPPVRVVGSQDVREQAAEDSAKKAWAEAVRWNAGEAFMNIENSEGYQRMCSRSSIGEALGATLSRCEVVAKPCRPGMSKGEGK